MLTGRGCAVQFGCVLCTSTDMETRDHLFLACPYAGEFWLGLTAELNLPRITETDPLTAWRRGRKRLQGASRRRWDTAWAAGTWSLWKERNRRTFSQQRKPADILINAATIEVHNWAVFI